MYFGTVFSALFILPLATPSLSSCPSRIIRDGGFESTFEDAWNVLTFPASNFELTRPGSTNHGSKHAFTALAYPGPFSDGGAILWQDLRTCAGKNYSITADYRFSQENDDCSMMIEYPFQDARGSVTIGGAISPAGIWYTTGMSFLLLMK